MLRCMYGVYTNYQQYNFKRCEPLFTRPPQQTTITCVTPQYGSPRVIGAPLLWGLYYGRYFWKLPYAVYGPARNPPARVPRMCSPLQSCLSPWLEEEEEASSGISPPSSQRFHNLTATAFDGTRTSKVEKVMSLFVKLRAPGTVVLGAFEVQVPTLSRFQTWAIQSMMLSAMTSRVAQQHPVAPLTLGFRGESC